MKYTYRTKGVCAMAIVCEVEDDIVRSVEFIGGCSGNTQGVAKLVVGMRVEDVIERLSDIRCGGKPTSCPAQLAEALREMQREHA